MTRFLELQALCNVLPLDLKRVGYESKLYFVLQWFGLFKFKVAFTKITHRPDFRT